MKKYLFIALAALGFAACADNMDSPNGPIHNGELEESYIAINLMAADNDTRAAEDDYGYEEGTEAERKIKTAYFFFFDENGNPFNVTGAPATAPGGAKNHLSLTIGDTTGKVNPNVSDIKEAVLILNTYKGVYPKQVVAVLNWVPADKAYTLDELHSTIATIGNDTDGYVMSNSVYMDDADNMVDAVAITEDNIKTSSSLALDNPVDIYVERTAAKVVLTTNGKVAGSENIFNTQKPSSLVGQNNVDVYVKLLGWELYNDYNTSSLLKDIDTTWSVTDLGLTWNDIPYFRCYWAQSQRTPHNDNFAWKYNTPNDKGFPTEYGFAVGATTYCGENTNQVETNGESTLDPRTKVILKGQLMQKNGDNYEPLELASWYGNEYAGVANLKIAVANSLKYTLYSSVDGQTYTSITPADIECVAGVAGTEAYEVGFQLSNGGAEKTWYQYSSAGGYQMLGTVETNITATNTYLMSVEPALLYKDGQTYYFVDIEHLGTAGAKYGVVRNHVYQIDINTIKGYGSPVYIPTGNIVTPPEYPKDYEDSYVAARINVLSWKVVKQGVNIVQ